MKVSSREDDGQDLDLYTGVGVGGWGELPNPIYPSSPPTLTDQTACAHRVGGFMQPPVHPALPRMWPLPDLSPLTLGQEFSTLPPLGRAVV